MTGGGIRAVRVVTQTVKAKSDSLGITDLLLENLLEAAGGVSSSVTDAIVATTETKEDDKYADYLKPLLGNALKYLAKKTRKPGLKDFASAWNGHSYGESLGRWAKNRILKG